MDWFRSWHGTDRRQMATHCTEVRHNAGAGVGGILALLDYASQHADRRCSVADFDIETFAAWSGWDDADIAAIIDAMQQKDCHHGR